MEQKISIIIPAYNEEKRIKETLERYCLFFKNKKSDKKIKDFEILVVLNACTDNTLEIVKYEQIKNKQIKILNFKQGGKGFAITEGFKDSLKKDIDIIGFVDADMATSPEEFYKLIQNINNFDGIIASRYLKGSVVNPKQSFQRILASRIFNFLIKSILFLNYHDTQCGAKIFKRKTIQSITPELKITKWAFDVNLLYLCKKHNFKIKEFPTKWEDKEYSKINLKKAGPQMFLSLIRLRLIYSHFKKLVDIYDKLPSNFKLKF